MAMHYYLKCKVSEDAMNALCDDILKSSITSQTSLSFKQEYEIDVKELHTFFETLVKKIGSIEKFVQNTKVTNVENYRCQSAILREILYQRQQEIS